MTPHAFQTRLTDVFAILDQVNGDGKGRVVREAKETVISRMRAKGIEPPAGFMGK